MIASSLRTITPTQLYELIRKGEAVDIVDVRTPVEFREAHAYLVRNVPLDDLDPDTLMAECAEVEGKTVYFICRSGQRAAKAVQRCLQKGYDNVACVEGGTAAWDQEGLHVVYGAPGVSLERQVRIVAGLLGLIGAVLALVVHPYFAGIPAAVGAGMVFAGITDTCGMALLLTRMPWNRQAGCPSGRRSPG